GDHTKDIFGGFLADKAGRDLCYSRITSRRRAKLLCLDFEVGGFSRFYKRKGEGNKIHWSVEGNYWIFFLILCLCLVDWPQTRYRRK
ncbi:unnamed protein product, partial [Brassica oleracea]